MKKTLLNLLMIVALGMTIATPTNAIKRVRSNVSFGSGNNPFVDYTLSAPSAGATGCRNSDYYKAIPFIAGTATMVKFEQGNVQHCNNPDSDSDYPDVNWTIGEHQFDAISNQYTCDGSVCDNTKISSTYNMYYDLFGWGTSGKSYGATEYQPYATSTTSANYGNGTNDLSGDSDWGVNYGSQRTMTADEWNYLLFERKDADKLKRIVCVYDGLKNNGATAPIYGLLIMPEYSDELTQDRISAEEFNELEYMGGIFLPLNGYRKGTTVTYDGLEGYYWTATAGSTTSTAKALHIDARRNIVEIVEIDRATGCSVRLVSDAAYHEHTFALTYIGVDTALHCYKCTECTCFYGMEACTPEENPTWTCFASFNFCSFTCSKCGVESSGMSHNPEYTHIDGTSTHTRKCAWECGYSVTGSCQMVYGTDGDGEHYQYCKYCGYIDESTRTACTFTTYTGYGDGRHYSRCSTCGLTKISECTFSKYTGNEDGTHSATCSVCNATSTIACTPQTVESVAATCTTTGLTEGEICSVCSDVLKAQETTAALGHTWGEWTTDKASTCVNKGSKTRVCATDASHTETEDLELDANNHEDVVTDEAEDATCTTTGLTEGQHCEACHTILVEQETTAALGHLFTTYTYNEDATTEADGTETATCDRDDCDETDTRTAEGTKELATSISRIDKQKTNEGIYDMAGRRMEDRWENLPRGVYVVNGKLMIKK